MTQNGSDSINKYTVQNKSLIFIGQIFTASFMATPPIATIRILYAS